jgi:UDP-MurNAc hydroxylase
MKIHMIGHASLFIATEDVRILMDPVLWDPFCEGLNETCPKREVSVEQLPEYDFLVISHQHLDHFDVRSLAHLSRQVEVIIPPDRILHKSLLDLGYKNISSLHDFQQVQIGHTTLMATRSEIKVPEFGMVFSDPSGVFWNTVDTYFAPATIAMVRSHFPQIDFLLSTWHISLETRYQLNQHMAFPFALYRELLRLIRLIQPKAIAPGAQGWKYIDQAAWQNQVVFPLTRERFCHDIAQALPQIQDQIYVIDPGDIFTLAPGENRLDQASCDYVRMVEDDRTQIEFSPVNAGNPLVDTNPQHHEIHVLHQAITQAIFEFPQFIQEGRSTRFSSHHQWQLIYQIEVIFPDRHRIWHIDFSQAEIRAIESRHPLANFFTYITASSFYSLIQKQRNWDYLYCSGEYRQFHKVYRIDDSGLTIPPDGTLSDPLELKYPAEANDGENIAAELAQLKASHSNLWSSTQPMTGYSTLDLGNVLVKIKRQIQPRD